MIRYSKFILWITAVVLMAWLLPWGYRFVASKPSGFPFTMYSCVTNTFVSVDYADGKTKYRDFNGKQYTEKEFDSILPMFYYRQLIADGRMPKELKGVELTSRLIQQERFMLRHSPSDVNVVRPALYPLLEAMSGRVDLEMPGDVFRTTDKIEFIDMAANSVDAEKSGIYNDALSKKGFTFPSRRIAGNPTTRKEYDEGYFLIADDYQVFHMKQLRGRPFVRNTGINPELKMKYIFPTEFPGRHIFGLFSDENHKLYVLKTKSYGLQELPVPAFDPEKDNLLVIGDIFNWTIQVSNVQGVKLYAIDAQDYSLVDTAGYGAKENPADLVAAWIFPFELSFTDSLDKWVMPRVENVSLWALSTNTLLALIFLAVWRKELKRGLPCAVAILFLGVFVLIPLLLICDRR